MKLYGNFLQTVEKHLLKALQMELFHQGYLYQKHKNYLVFVQKCMKKLHSKIKES